VPESGELDFHSPYGCSKGSADQYVRDYHRIYGLPTVVFRRVAFMARGSSAMKTRGGRSFHHFQPDRPPLSIYGDGKQVRDVLFVDDL